MSGYNRAFRNMVNLIVGIIVLIILTGCAMKSEAEKFPVQGDDSYCINFQLPDPELVKDWSVWTYIYEPWNGERPLGRGGRCGYDAYYPLTLNFGFKDGRRFHEEIDIEELMRELAEKETIFDNRGTKWGGSAMLIVSFSIAELLVEYVVIERVLEPDYELNQFRYPLYRKELK